MDDPQARSTEAGVAKFASILGSLTPVQQQADPDRDPWNDEKLEDDMLRLSYEQAILTGASRTEAKADGGPTEQGIRRPMRAKSEAELCETPAAGPLKAARKSSSITVRLTRADYDQLHARADEAGVTVSAYLRSCAFEVESLRAQVKEALAQIRNPAAEKSDSLPAPQGRRHLRWLPRWSWRNSVARA